MFKTLLLQFQAVIDQNTYEFEVSIHLSLITSMEKNMYTPSSATLNRVISDLIVSGQLMPSMIETPALATLIIDINHTFGVYGSSNLDRLPKASHWWVLIGFARGANRWSFVLSTAPHSIYT